MQNPHTADESLVRLERVFADHIRNPEHSPAPQDVEPRRMAIYRDLFFNNIRGFLEEGFPVLHSLMPEDSWNSLVRDFMSSHSCQTPLFAELSQEFLSYLEKQQSRGTLSPPFMWELAHYEWVELALTISEAERLDGPVDPNGDLLQSHPVLSPLAWPLCYQYPVHKIDVNNQPDRPGDVASCLLVYRDSNDRISFLEINPLIYWLLNLLQSEDQISGSQALDAAVEQLSPNDPETLRGAGVQFLEELRRRGIIVGTLSEIEGHHHD
jgi:hypothetical protein